MIFRFRAGMQELVRELGTGFDEMLAVIQDEEQLFAAQIIRDSVNEWDTLDFTQVESGCNR